MTLTDLVAPNAIIPALKVNNKKQALQELAARAAALSGQNERAIFDILMQREKLGSTAVGNGIAIPHGKMPNLTRLFGLFARLDRDGDGVIRADDLDWSSESEYLQQLGHARQLLRRADRDGDGSQGRGPQRPRPDRHDPHQCRHLHRHLDLHRRHRQLQQRLGPSQRPNRQGQRRHQRQRLPRDL